MDKNGKIRGKISIVDLIVILIIITIAAGSIYRFTSPATAVDPGEVTINYTLRVAVAREIVLEYYLRMATENLPVFDRNTNLYIGSVTNVRHRPRYVHEVLPDGSLVYARRPGEVVIYIDITAIGRQTPTAIFVGGTREINVGGTVLMRSKYVDVETTVNTIEISE